MRRAIIWASVAAVLLTIIVVVIVAMVLPRLRSSLITAMLPSGGATYPSAPAMPAVVATPVEELLSQHEAFLKSNVPTAHAALQPGLSDAEIDAIENQHSFKLTADLRALYRWHNGTAPGANVDAFPNHQFVPLDVA